MTSTILRVACDDCDEERVVFRNAASPIECDDCGAALATPTGGEAALDAAIVEVVQAGDTGLHADGTVEA